MGAEAILIPLIPVECPDGRACTQEDCTGTLVKIERQQIKEASGSGALFGALTSATFALQESFKDVENCWWYIVLFGAVFAVIISVVYIVILRVCSRLMVWLIITSVFVMLALFDIYLFVRNGDFFGIDMGAVATKWNEEIANKTQGYDGVTQAEDYRELFTVAAYAGFVITCVYFVLVITQIDKINLCIRIIENSSTFLAKLPGIVTFPVGVYATQLFFFLLAVFMCSLISTMGDLTIADLSKAYEATMANDCFTQGKAAKQCIEDSLTGVSLKNDTNTVFTPNATAGVLAAEAGVANAVDNAIDTEMKAALLAENYQTGTWRDQDVGTLMYGYTLITFLWTVQICQATAFLIMATAVATLYWSPVFIDRDGDGKNDSKWPVLHAIKQTFRYHFGSVVFGSLLITIFELLRIMLAYLDKHTRGLQEANTLVKCVMKAAACCLWCFEKVIKYLTRNAYIYIAITGDNFLTAAWGAFKLVFANPLRCMIIQSTIWALSMLGRFGIVMSTTACFWLYITFGEEFQPNGDKPVSRPEYPALCVAILSYLVANAFMVAYECTTDTLLLSFLLDEKFAKERGAGYVLHAKEFGMDNFMDANALNGDDEEAHGQSLQDAQEKKQEKKMLLESEP